MNGLYNRSVMVPFEKRDDCLSFAVTEIKSNVYGENTCSKCCFFDDGKEYNRRCTMRRYRALPHRERITCVARTYFILSEPATELLKTL